MISAKEAYARTKKSRDENIHNILNEIETDIIREADSGSGDCSIYYDGQLPVDVVNILKENGYKLHYDFESIEDWTKISWYNAK